MTDTRENLRNSGGEPMVSAEYHSLATDRAPDELNQAVLHSSRKALGRRPSPGWRSAWLRPVASAAVIALSLTVILEFNDVGNPQPTLTSGDEINPFGNSPDVFREAVDNAAEQLREAEVAASRASQNSVPDEPPAMDSGANLEQTTLLPIDGGCNAAQRSTMTTWWQCIESLESRGASALAEQELAALLGSYPAFVEPGQ